MKRFQVKEQNGKGILTFDGKPLFEDLGATVTLIRKAPNPLLLTQIEEREDSTVLTFSEGERNSHPWWRELNSFTLTLREKEGVLQLCLDAQTRYPSRGYFLHTFASDRAVVLGLRPVGEYRVLGHLLGSYFTDPCFSIHDPEDRERGMQDLLFEIGALHCHLLPLPGNNYRAELIEGDLTLSVGVNNQYHLQGPIMTLSVANDPLTAVRENYRRGKEMGSIWVNLRDERPFPRQLKGFGWCTWDAFRRDITADKLYAKLEEFQRLGIVPQFLLIDDGWMQYDSVETDERRLVSFIEDREKFPAGLKETVRIIKEKYGVRYVGVWHALFGFWNGVTPDGEIARELSDHLVCNNGDQWIMKPTAEDAFVFYDTWHSYLADCGVDFVKVDGQAAVTYRYEGMMPTAPAARAVFEGLERSVEKNFGGVMINCMGMSLENNLQRAASPLNRNSEDFFPRREDNFIQHLFLNAYNAIYEQDLYQCDFDMWWSKQEFAVQHGVLRGISGGPVYVCDMPDYTEEKTIFPLLGEEGTVLMPAGTALPTLDLIYTDCRRDGVPQKIWNYKDDAYVVAAFGVSEEKAEGHLSLSDIPKAAGKTYLAYEYFTRSYTLIDDAHPISLSLVKNGFRLYNLYPVDADGFACVGAEDKYVGIATKRQRVKASEKIR